MNAYELETAAATGFTGELKVRHPWRLPGLENCERCGATWATTGLQYPCIDLSAFPQHTSYREARIEPQGELDRLTEQLRDWIPSGILLRPGASFGPMEGTARGVFGHFHLPNPWTLCMHREALEQLQAAGVHGLQGCRMNLRSRGTPPPELLELQLERHGHFHPDCLPAAQQPPCARCGRDTAALPDPYLLDAASLPTTVDVFRLADWPTLILATQRFVDAVQRLELDGVTFRQVEVR
ncbi:SitI6 family double-CXXCG motif immunity protein [Myxococcus vastator]|uniref:SitI6 family double-CXXCG motif immunity protein n=1 Tax=Myxococcus vastator TaxID=2709664 RepID=UPI00196851B0|nr:double-CXXCG motif protein [Myxococcus vastator]